MYRLEGHPDHSYREKHLVLEDAAADRRRPTVGDRVRIVVGPGAGSSAVITRDERTKISEAAAQLCRALEDISGNDPLATKADKEGTGRVLLVDKGVLQKRFGKRVIDALGTNPRNRYRVTAWMTEEEEHHRYVVLVGDGGGETPWNVICRDQACAGSCAQLPAAPARE